jgi:hypothetical protein
MYTVAKAAHTRATSFAVAQHSFLQLLKLKMTTTVTDYVDRLLAQKDAFTAIFDPEGTGMMAIENIITMVLINGLPDEFKYMKDLMFSKDLMGEFPDFKETLQAMMTYDLNKQKVDDSSNIVVPPGPTILTATSTVGLEAECGICHKEFNATLRKSDGKHHPNCYPCNLKARQAKESATTNPTSAQVASAQASLKKAQAVLLAAKVDYNVTEPVLSTLPVYDTNRLNKYMMSDNYSLTATALTLSASDVSTDLPWQLDSGATFSCTNAISDLRQPSQLTDPIPIKGADGTIIFAKHTSSLVLLSNLSA